MSEARHEVPIESLRDTIRRWQRALGISQNQFATRAGVDGSVLSRVLAGKAVAGPTVRKAQQYITRLERKVAGR